MAAGPTGLQRRAITNHFRNAGGPLTNCYRLNSCVPPTFKCWSHNPQCDNIWRLWEVSRSSELNLYKWDLVLLEEERWERWSLSTTWGYSNKVAIVCKPGRSFSPHTTLNLPAPWTWTSHSLELWERIVCCLNCSDYGMYHSSPDWLTQAYGPNPTCCLFLYSCQAKNGFYVF